MMTREEAIKIVKECDGEPDHLAVKDFSDFCGYAETEFWKSVDGFYNRNLFPKNEFGQ